MAAIEQDPLTIHKCVYCLTETNQLLADNIFGQTWQGLTPDEKLARWQAPACLSCANKFNTIEHDFLMDIGNLFAPVEIALLGIPSDVEDFIKAKTEDRRKGITEKSSADEILFRQIVRGASIDPKLVAKVKSQNKYDRILNIKRLVARFVRGLIFSIHSCIIDKNHKLEIYFTHELDPKPIRDTMESVGCQIFCGKGVRIRASLAEDDLQSGIFEVKIWENLTVYAFAK